MGLLGELLLRNDAATYTPAVPRQADSATFKVDVVTFHDAGGAPSLTVTIEHRNENENTWTTAETFTAITAAGLATRDVSGLRDLVRLKFVFTAGPAASYVRFLILPPVWELAQRDDREWPDDDPTILEEFVEEELPDTAVLGGGSNGRLMGVGV
jgi:hypothetical protein